MSVAECLPRRIFNALKQTFREILGTGGPTDTRTIHEKVC